MQRMRLLSLFALVAAFSLATPPVVCAASPLVAAGSPPGDISKYIFGHASINNAYSQHLQAGLEALDQRVYAQAEAHLSAAMSELRKHNISDERWLKAKLALAQAYLGEERLEIAERNFADVATHAKDADTREQALAGWAETERELGDFKKAHALCDQALNLQEQSHAVPAKKLATVYGTLGGVLVGEELHKAAIATFQQGLKSVENEPDSDHVAAQLRYEAAIEMANSGLSEEAAPLFQRAFSTMDSESKFNQPLYSAPATVIRWEQGNPHARQIADNEYPLKYLLDNNLRVAAAAVRSENVIGILISLANCGHSRMQLAVGPVNFEQLLPKRKMFLYVPPRELDITLEQEHVTELTWRRRWLNHIEKTRFIPGYLKNNSLDVDNFFGNNIFGEYANWPIIANDETPIVTREEFLYGRNKQRDISTADFLSGGSVGYRPTYLEPGESKTGLVFFKQERFDDSRLRIVIGNTIFEIPFANAGPR